MNKSTKTVKLEDSNVFLIKKLLKSRKRSFISSLREILYQISHDRVVKDLLQERTSFQFILERVCEIIEDVIKDGREKYITSLYGRVVAIERFYKSEQMEKLLSIKKKLINAIRSQSADEVAHVRKIQMLTEHVKELESVILAFNKEKIEEIVEVEEAPKVEKYKFKIEDERFYHNYAYTDLTQIANKLRIIDTGNKSIQVMMITARDSITSMIRQFRERGLEYCKSLSFIVRKQYNDIAHLKNHYENIVIPQIRGDYQQQSLEFRKREDSLLEDIKKMRHIVGEKDDEILKLMDGKNKQDLYIENLVNSLNNEKENHKRLEIRIKYINDELSIKDKEISQKNDQLSSLENEKNILNTKVEQLKSVCEKSINDLERSKKSKEKIKSKCKKNSETNKYLKKEVHILKMILESTNNQLKAVSRKLIRNGAKLKKFIPNLYDKRSEKPLHKVKPRVHSDNADSKRNYIKDIEKKMEDCESHLSQARSEILELSSRLSDGVLSYRLAEEDIRSNGQTINDINGKLMDNCIENMNYMTEIRRLKDLVNNQSNDINALKIYHNTIREKTDMVNKLKDENNAYKKKITEQEKTLNDLLKNKEVFEEQIFEQREKIFHLEGIKMDYGEKIEKLQRLAEEMKNYIVPFQRLFPSLSPKEIETRIKGLVDDNNSLKNTLNQLKVSGKTEIDGRISKLLEVENNWNKISSLYPMMNVEQIVNSVQKMQKQNNELLTEQKRIHNILGHNTNIDISKVIGEIIEKQRTSDDKLKNASNFMSEVMRTITGDSSATIIFPIPFDLQSQLLKLVQRIREKALRDSNFVDLLLEEAKNNGFDGDEPIMATRFLIGLSKRHAS